MEFGIVIALLVGLLFVVPRLRMLINNNSPIKVQSAKEALVLARVRQLKYFYIHAGIFIITLLAAFALALLLDEGRTAVIVTVVWGLVVALHAFYVFGINGIMQDWERRRVKEMLQEDEKGQ